MLFFLWQVLLDREKTTSEHCSPLVHIPKNLLLSLAHHSLALLSIEPPHLVEPRIVIALLMKLYFLVKFFFQKIVFSMESGL